MQFIKSDTKIDFVAWRRPTALASTVLVFLSLILFVFVGPNWGIDFTGGNEIQLQFSEDVAIGEVRDALATMGVGTDAVQQLGAVAENSFTIRIQDPRFGSEGVQTEVEQALRQTFGAGWIAESSFVAEVSNKLTVRYTGDVVPVSSITDALASVPGAKVRPAPDDKTVYIDLPALSSKISDQIEAAVGGKRFEVLSIDAVGPKVGAELRTQGIVAIFSTLALVLVYVAFRFDLAFAPGAVLALFHDVVVVVGVFVITRHEFNLPMIGALLTIIGYSLNDTIVIYDRIRENMGRYRRRELGALINDSVNETVSRTLATSFTTALGMLAFLFFGGPVIETFALAILMGIVVGTYSTVFVASPMILVMQDLRPMLERMIAPLAGGGSGDAKDGSGEGGEIAHPEALTETERRRRERQAPRSDTP